MIGIGESARRFAANLRAAGIPPRPWLADAALPYETTVVWRNPDRYGMDVDLDELLAR